MEISVDLLLEWTKFFTLLMKMDIFKYEPQNYTFAFLLMEKDNSANFVDIYYSKVGKILFLLVSVD